MFQVDYTEWKDTLDKYKAEMEKELAEVRAAKQDLIDLHNKMQEMVFSGRYERDEDTLILSAPNIIIGNVDKSGNLLSGTSNIVLRGHNVALEGVGNVAGDSVAGGTVTTRARYVNVQTVDPGIDGIESVAFPDSRFAVQSAAVAFSAEDITPSPSGGVFTLDPEPLAGCINLNADSNINIVSACATHDENLDTDATNLESETEDYGKVADEAIAQAGSNIKDLDKTQNNMWLDMLGAASEEADTMALRTGLYEYEDRSNKSERLTSDLTQNISECIHNLSIQAEGKRIAKYLKARSEELSAKQSSYDTESTGSNINISSERVVLSTTGADGKLRTSPGNGLVFNSQNFTFSTMDEGMNPIPDSTFSVVANTIDIDASDYTYKNQGDDVLLNQTEAKGKITLNAKEIDLTGNDATYAPDGDTLKATTTLTKGSILYANFSNTHFDLADEKGKAQGTFLVNGKDVYLSSYDVDNENRVTPTAITEGGKVTMGANEVYLGSVVKDMKSETVQVAGKNVNILGEEKVNLQQEADKSHLLLDDNAELCGTEVKLVGNITLGGETKIDAKFTAGDVELQNLKAASSITGPNIKDGMPVPAAASPAQPGKGAKLKELEGLESMKEKEDSSAQG